MKLNTKQVKKIDVHLKNVKGFLTSFFKLNEHIILLTSLLFAGQ